MPSPSGDQTKREWFEVLVMADVDLNQVGLDRVSDTNIPPDLLQSVDCIHVTAGTRLVFARSAVTADNGGLPAVAGTFSFTMLAGSQAAPGDVRLGDRAGGTRDGSRAVLHLRGERRGRKGQCRDGSERSGGGHQS